MEPPTSWMLHGWYLHHLVSLQTLGGESLADDGATAGEHAAGTFAQQDLNEAWQNVTRGFNVASGYLP